MKSWSVGGIHPTEGDLVYGACQCFRSAEDAQQWRDAAIGVWGPIWWLASVLQDRDLPDGTDLPPVELLIARLHNQPAHGAGT